MQFNSSDIIPFNFYYNSNTLLAFLPFVAFPQSIYLMNSKSLSVQYLHVLLQYFLRNLLILLNQYIIFQVQCLCHSVQYLIHCSYCLVPLSKVHLILCQYCSIKHFPRFFSKIRNGISALASILLFTGIYR